MAAQGLYLPNLRKARLFRGWTQATMSLKSTVSKTSITNIEAQASSAHPESARKLADALGYEIWQLADKDPEVLKTGKSGGLVDAES